MMRMGLFELNQELLNPTKKIKQNLMHLKMQ